MRVFGYLAVFCAVFYLILPYITNSFDAPPDIKQYRCSADTDKGRHDPLNDPRPTDNIKLIKITNAGEFVDRCALTDVLFDLNWDSPPGPVRPPIKNQAKSLPKLVILYIHGWKHNGEEKDTDFVHFCQLFQDLRVRFKNQKNVVGVYVAWNAAFGFAPFDNLSFWSKEAVADRIAQSAIVTKILSSIGALMHREGDKPDQFLALGHSFGARLLFSATSQSLITSAENAHPGHYGGDYKLFKSSADTVVLLNPAFEASMYTSLDAFRRTEESFGQLQRPLVISVSTSNDWATKTAFPIGQWFGGARSPREKTTLGNYSVYFTHKLQLSTKEQCGEVGGFRDGMCLLPIYGKADEREAQRYEQLHNPFFVITTDGSIIDGHNGIWDRRFQSWLFDTLIALVYSKDTAQPTDALNVK